MRATALAIIVFSLPAIAGPPTEATKGWFANCGPLGRTSCVDVGSHVGALDREVFFQGAASFSVASETSRSPEFGGVMQTAKAEAYRGKRIRYSAEVRCQNVSAWTGLWLRLDRADGTGLAFDNMKTSGRALSGSHGWERHSVVLDVPQDASAVHFGLVLSGSGKVWLDAVRIDVVTPDIPVTAGPESGAGLINAAVPVERLAPPKNLDFED